MKNDASIKLLEEQIEKIDSLIKPPAFNPEYKMWDQTTRRILESMFDRKTVELFTSILPSRTASTEEGLVSQRQFYSLRMGARSLATYMG